MLKKHLKNAGLTEAEAIIYETLLKLKESTTGLIIKETKLQSSTIYHCLESLIKKGLVSYIIKNNVKHFKAESPEVLEDFIKKQQEKLKESKNEISKLISSIKPKKEEKEEVKMFKGWRGLQTAFYECISELTSKDIIYVFTLSIYAGADLDMTRYLINKIRDWRVKKRIKSQIIINESEKKTLGEDHEKTPFTEVKYLPENLSHPAIIHVYKNKVLIVISTKQPTAILIQNKAMRESFKNYFELLWKIAKKK